MTREEELMTPVTLDPQGPFKRDPPAPQQMRDRLTPTQDVVVLCHLGVPRIEREHWSLTIEGMVERRHVWTERSWELLQSQSAISQHH